MNGRTSYNRWTFLLDKIFAKLNLKLKHHVNSFTLLRTRITNFMSYFISFINLFITATSRAVALQCLQTSDLWIWDAKRLWTHPIPTAQCIKLEEKKKFFSIIKPIHQNFLWFLESLSLSIIPIPKFQLGCVMPNYKSKRDKI